MTDARKTEEQAQATAKRHRSRLRSVSPLLQVGIPLLASTLFFGVALGIEGDVIFKRSGGQGGNPPARFPHWAHRIRYRCYACHPAPFRMGAGANQASMELIQQGKSCGACHNGKTAWGVTLDTCNRCHAGQ